MPEIIDEVGNRYGRWTVLEEGGRTPARKVMWLCLCDCGRLSEVIGRSLRSGASKSCGCLKAEITSQVRATHRMSEHPAFKSYHGAKQRCTNPNNPGFSDYGGRGIKFNLPEFSEFWAVMMSSWFDGASIDRIDNEGDYAIDNVRWATPKVQAGNRRNSKAITSTDGRTLNLADWAKELGICHTSLAFRLRHWPIEVALTKRKTGKGGRPARKDRK